jgi:hypothetical protein
MSQPIQRSAPTQVAVHTGPGMDQAGDGLPGLAANLLYAQIFRINGDHVFGFNV